mgnify:CR=1 FL=1
MGTNIEQVELAKIRQLWVLASIFDGINPDSRFAVFSDDNPYATAHSTALMAYIEPKAVS